VTTIAFKEEAFTTFSVDGLDERMHEIITNIRPSFSKLGDIFTPKLAEMTGEEFFPHIAKHARRTVNPPKDTWIAFAANKRGYKMLPHFQVGLWGSHVFVWFALIYECTLKEEYGRQFERELDTIHEHIPAHFVWSMDHMKPGATVHGELNKEELQAMFTRLQKVKKAELLCGVNIPREKAITMTEEEWIQTIEETYKTLLPLYKLGRR
jgi:uncharacterized protein YktB (UPF0637 family)